MKNLLNKNNIWRFDSIRISVDSTYRSILLTVTTSCIPDDTNSLILLATGCTNLFPPESTSNSGYMIINIAVSHLIFFKVRIRAGNDGTSIDLPISQYKHDVLGLWLMLELMRHHGMTKINYHTMPTIKECWNPLSQNVMLSWVGRCFPCHK